MAAQWKLSLLAALTMIASLALAAPADAQEGWQCDGQTATIVGTPGDDVLVGTDEADVIVGREGDDTITALDGDDIVCAGKGDDEVFGGGGFDIIFGAQGDDRLYAADGRGLKDRVDTRGARMFGGAGADTIHGSDRWDRMQGGPGVDQLYGHEGRDWIRAGAQDDFVNGGLGIDDVHGGNGRDQITVGASDHVKGGAGLDACEVFNGEPQTLRSCGRTSLPQALSINQSGSDVIRVFRELDGALEYLRQRPHLVDSSRFAEGRGGATDLQFQADRGFATEVSRPQDTRSLDVSVQGWAGPDYVQLYVVERRNEVGRRVLDEFGVERWRDHGWDEPTQTWVVGMRRTNGNWRIAERVAAIPRGANAQLYNGFFTPRTIPAISANEVVYGAGYSGPLRWVIRGWVDGNGDNCIEIRLGANRHVTCVDRARAAYVRDEQVVQYVVGSLREPWGYVLGFGPSLANGGFLPFTVTGKTAGNNGAFARPDRLGNIRMFVSLKQSWFSEVTVRNGQSGPIVGTSSHHGRYECNAWNAGGGVEGTFSTAAYGKNSPGRKDTRAELEQYILQHVDRTYAAPKVRIVRNAPANTGVFTSIPADPSWFVVKVKDWANNAEGKTRTWALALGKDGAGWYIGDSHLRQDCAPKSP